MVFFIQCFLLRFVKKRPLTNSRTNKYLRYVTIVSQQMMNQYENLYKPVDIDEAVFSKMKYVNCESASNLDDPNLPATIGIVAGGDVLRDEGISYFEKYFVFIMHI